MSSTHASLEAAATERKSRLAKLKSLKRKVPDPYDHSEGPANADAENTIALSSESSVTTKYLSGRNYDPETQGPKLGFEAPPTENQETLEERAAQIAEETTLQAEREEKEDKPIDLFKLQPKKPNWDLKRDLARKMEILTARTENAIARLVRERIESANRKLEALVDEGETAMQGVELVEGVHAREREEKEAERRGREDDESS